MLPLSDAAAGCVCDYALYICIVLADLLKMLLFFFFFFIFQSTDKYAEFDLNDQGEIGKCVCVSVCMCS